MDQTIRNTLRETVLAARSLLENAIREELQGRLGIYTANTKGRGTLGLVVEDDARMGHLEPDERETRRLLLDHVDVLQTGGLAAPSALDTFVRETAFTWLNRFVAFKMLESRGLARETVSRLENSNGFKMWLAEPGNETHLSDYEKGDLPQNGRGEGPRQLAYRAFLLAQCRKLSEEVRVLFDPDALVSRFLPQPKVLRELANFLNAPDLAQAWQPGNEETIGWVYQGFNEQEKKIFSFGCIRGRKRRNLKISQQLPKSSHPVGSSVFWSKIPSAVSGSNCTPTPNWHLLWIILSHSKLPTAHLRLLEAPKKLLSSILPAVPCTSAWWPLTVREHVSGGDAKRWQTRLAGKTTGASEDEISDAIIAHNLHGIDIDQRAVQLSALTLYLKAKTLNPKARISESRLACANVHMLDGDNLKDFVEQMKLGPIYRRILTALQARLKDSEQLGSLLRLEGEIRELVAEERKRYEREKMPFSQVGRATSLKLKRGNASSGKPWKSRSARRSMHSPVSISVGRSKPSLRGKPPRACVCSNSWRSATMWW